MAPSPIINLFAVKFDLPVPPYGTLIVLADQEPILIFPIAVTCVKLLLTLNVLPTLSIPVPALIPDVKTLVSTYSLVAASVSATGFPTLVNLALLVSIKCFTFTDPK